MPSTPLATICRRRGHSAAALLPVIAQHRRAGAQLASGAAGAADVAAEALGGIDPETLRFVNGSIDVDRVAGLDRPFAELDAAMASLYTTLDDVRTTWLAEPIDERLDAVAAELTANRERLMKARRAIEVAPALLGDDGERHYFVAFTTPAEARGLGGFMGNWAEFTVFRGKIKFTDFGRTAELNSGGPDPDARVITAPSEFLSGWGRFGFVDPADDTTSVVPWSNITMPPDFPTVAAVVDQLYPQSGGRPIDGVFALDPKAVAALMSFTGAIELPQQGLTLTSANVEKFITVDQYHLITDDVTRIRALELIFKTTVERLTTTALPPPADLAKVFGPLAADGRFVAWSQVEREQAMFETVGMAGSFPELAGHDGLAVTVDNAAPNKADAFLHVDIDYSALEFASGETSGVATITLRNDAPAGGGGLPGEVLNNEFDLEVGSNRMYFSVYTALPVKAVTIDGVATTVEVRTAFGWNVAARYVVVPPGTGVVITVEVLGTLTAPEYKLVARAQPFANPLTMTSEYVPLTNP